MSSLDAGEPISNFGECHVDIIRWLDELSELPVMLDAAARSQVIAKRSLEFFRRVVVEHHQDEERELFPAVTESAEPGTERLEVTAMVERLTAEHRGIETLWASVEGDLARVVKGKGTSLSTAHLRDLVSRYAAHAAFEQEHFLPLAERILSRNSRHMAALGLSLHMRHVKDTPTYL